jgi:hypothetical protein
MKLEFSINKPLTVRLHAIEGKERESQFGGAQHLFTAEEGVFYVSEAAGKLITAQCKSLGVNPGDAVEVCKAEVDAGRGRKSIQWIVSVPLDGKQPEPPQSLEEQLRASIREVPAVRRQQPAAAPTVAPGAPERPRWAEVLAINTCVLVDVYSAVLKHANEQQAGIRPDDVRALLTTMFIQYAQKGGISNAA